MDINHTIQLAQSGDLAAIIAIADDRQHWDDGRQTLPCVVPPELKHAMIKLMFEYSKKDVPEALVRLGKCFWYGEGVPENNLAALACWHNAFEIAAQHANPDAQPGDRFRGVLLEMSMTIKNAHKWMVDNGFKPLDRRTGTGMLYDLARFFTWPD